MDLLQFHRVRTAIQGNASPGSVDDLATLEGSLRLLLMTSGLFDEVEVEYTDDPDQLVIALCTFPGHVAEVDVAHRLEQLWADRVAYPFWEAHALHVEGGYVELEAASRPSSEGGYITVHLVAQAVRIPAQRPGQHAVSEDRQPVDR